MTETPPTEVKTLATIEGFGVVCEASGRFDLALRALQQEGADIMSARDLAYVVMHSDPKEYFPDPSGFVKEGVVYMPRDNKAMLTRVSPIVRCPEEATDEEEEGRNCAVPILLMREYTRRTKKNASVLSLEKVSDLDKDIPAKEFGKNRITRWIFQDQAATYGYFLHRIGISKLGFDNDSKITFKDKTERPYACQFWHCIVDDGVVIFAKSGISYVNDGISLLGIKKEEKKDVSH